MNGSENFVVWGYFAGVAMISLPVMWNTHLRRAVLLKSIAVAAVLCLVFQIYARINLGYFDSLVLIGVIVQLFFGVLVSYAVGEILIHVKHRR